MTFELRPYPKKRRNDEDAMCIGFWRGFQMKYKHLVPVTTHFPAGGQRTARTGKLLKDLGTQAGFPDYQILTARGGFHGLFLEFKTRRGRVTDSQQFRLEALRGQGYACGIVRSSEEAFQLIDLYLEHKYFPRPDFEFKQRKEKKADVASDAVAD